MGRIGCILVANFSIAALVRANPALDDAALALSATPAPHSELLAVSARARRAGVYPAMTIAQARSIVPDLVVAHRSQAAEESAMDALADAAESVSPMVEKGEDGCVWLDLAGLGRLYGSEDAIASELTRRAARVGMQGAVGIASNKEIAMLAARCGGIRVIDPAREREFLDWLPLDVLELGADPALKIDLETTLARWGIRRLGDLARLDPDAVGSRLGRRGVELVRIARGGEPAPLHARRRAELFTETAELDYGIETLEPLGFVMLPMLERACERLAMRGMVAGDILLTFGLGDHRTFTRKVAIGAPSNDVRAMIALIALNLEAAPPEAAVETLRLDVEPRNPRAAQTDLFLPPAPAPDKLELTLARLAALCGPDRVGTLRAEDSYRPEAVRVEKFVPPPPAPCQSNGAAHDVAPLAIRALRPPLEVEVLMNRGVPEFVRGNNLGARVVSMAGPWRRDGEWWNCGENGAARNGHHAVPFKRDYYELALADGGVYRIFHEIGSAKWFVDGIYD